jgi:hypothetical protein
MKKLNILVLALVFGLTLAACDNNTTNGEEREPVTYSGTSGGATYTLTISPPGSRAVLAGDDYELTITQTGGTKRSTGKVKSVSQNTFTLQPAVGGSSSFTVTADGEGITGITGDITLEDGTIAGAPGTVSGGNQGGGTSSVQGTFVSVASNGGLYSITITGSRYSSSFMGLVMHEGNVTVTGNTISCTVTAVYSPMYQGSTITPNLKAGDVWTFTITDSNTIVNNGNPYKKQGETINVQGTYAVSYNNGLLSIAISASNYVIAFSGYVMDEGTVTFVGNYGICTVTTVRNEGGNSRDSKPGDVWTFTIIDANTITHNGKTYRKQ